jgi:hypothetical protein
MSDVTARGSEAETVASGEADASRLQAPGGDPPTARAAVDIVLPVYNERATLASSVHTLRDYLEREFTFPFQITIADSASTDGTFDVARALALEIPEVTVLRLSRNGRGRALRAAWGTSEADVLAYMDVDLSTDLSALGPLISPLLAGRGDIAIGSRLLPGSQVKRGLKREIISRAYNLLLAAALGVGFSDAQCGFKAGRRELIQGLLADVEDDGWFFDTELLFLAQRRKLAIHEVPVQWVEDRDSRVDILATARDDLRGIMRLRAAAGLRARRRTDLAPDAAPSCRQPKLGGRRAPGAQPGPRATSRGSRTPGTLLERGRSSRSGAPSGSLPPAAGTAGSPVQSHSRARSGAQ